MAVTTQEILYKALKFIFPEREIQQNVRKGLNLKYENSNLYMECDLMIPSLKLCFEFQDEHHYTTTWYCNRTLKTVMQKDVFKCEKIQQIGMSFIAVPCWWDGDATSLIEQIKFHRPDISFVSLSPSLFQPYSLNPPLNYFENIGEIIPDVGELMLVSYPREFSIIGYDWWMGEKYDGIRCCWNHLNDTAYTRKGNKIEMAPSFSKLLPSVFVDGELWFGRGQFNTCFFLVNASMKSSHWSELRLISFDDPDPLSSRDYEHRYANLLHNVPADHPFNLITARMMISGVPELHEKFMQNIICVGGEGLILQVCGSLYENGLRSNSLLKLKTTQSDSEGIVTSIDKIGNMSVKQPDDAVVVFLKENIAIPSVAVGDIVTFEYDIDSRSDRPRNPKIVRVRNDLSWKDVVHSYLHESHTHNGSWMTALDRKQFLIDFAKKNGFDPQNPENWYSQTATNILHTKGGFRVLHYHQNKLSNALIDLFPDIGLDKSKFITQESWKSLVDRREFFINFAEKNGFDPLKPENWYLQTRNSVYQTKGGSGILSYYDKKLSRALLDLFPDIGLEKSKFNNEGVKSSWESESNRRQFFINFAKENGFDPLNSENWYSQTRKNIYQMKGGYRILHYYKKKLSNALFDLFPDVGFDKSKFNSKEVWKSVADRRQFFINFATKHGFDPLDAENWYLQTRRNIYQMKGGSGILHYYNKKLSMALLDLFPDIGLVKSQFASKVSIVEREEA